MVVADVHVLFVVNQGWIAFQWIIKKVAAGFIEDQSIDRGICFILI